VDVNQRGKGIPIIKIVPSSDCTDPFPFLELPREIRDLIYGIIGPDAGIENVSGHSSLLDIGYDIPRALLHVNRQFHYEFSEEMGRRITYPLKLYERSTRKFHLKT
jgi:hypothetical protein